MSESNKQTNKETVINTFISDLIPEDIRNITFNDLMRRTDTDVEINKKNNVMEIKLQTSSEIINVRVRNYDKADEVAGLQTSCDIPVSQKQSTISKMLDEGKTQIEIADILGTSQSNISKIISKMKNKSDNEFINPLTPKQKK